MNHPPGLFGNVFVPAAVKLWFSQAQTISQSERYPPANFRGNYNMILYFIFSRPVMADIMDDSLPGNLIMIDINACNRNAAAGSGLV